MRVLRIADVPGNRLGGMSRTMFSTGDELTRLGHDVEYAFTESLVVKGHRRLRRFLVPLIIPRLVASRAKNGRRYDAVEIHQPLAWFYAGMRRRTRAGPPAVVLSYGLEERGVQAELAYRQKKGLPTPARSRASTAVMSRLAAYGARAADHVIVSNSGDAAYLHAEGMPLDRITVHSSGVAPHFIAAGQRALESSAPRSGIVFLGSWLVRKGILDLVPAVSDLLTRHPALSFTAAGTGVHRETVLGAFPAHLQPRVDVLPALASDDEVIDVLRRHRIFVLPSYFEGSPLALIEAAALGLAPVTTDTSGMADFIRSGTNGFTVPVGDPGALARHMETLVTDDTLAGNMGREAALAAHRLTWAGAAEKMAGAYARAAA